MKRGQAWDHKHRFRHLDEVRPYDFEDADKLLFDFFDLVERACKEEGVPYDIVSEDEYEQDNDDFDDQE